MSDIGPILRSLRERAGLTLREVGEITGMSFRTIWGYESGTNDVTIPKLRTVAKALGLTVDIHFRPLDPNGDLDEVSPAQAELLNVVHRDVRGLTDDDVGLLLTLIERMKK